MIQHTDEIQAALVDALGLLDQARDLAEQDNRRRCMRSIELAQDYICRAARQSCVQARTVDTVAIAGVDNGTTPSEETT